MKAFTLSLTLLAAILASAPAPQAAEPAPATPARSCCARAATAEPLPSYSDQSLYQADSKWTTDDGKSLKLGDLAGKPQVVLMFFSKCTSACPFLLNDLKRISDSLTPEQRARVGFTLVSFDTETDTPATLTEYRRSWDLPVKNWTLLAGNADNVQELAALLGLQYRKVATGNFVHSNVITVLNAKGEIAHQQVGLNQDITDTVRTLVKLLSN